MGWRVTLDVTGIAGEAWDAWCASRLPDGWHSEGERAGWETWIVPIASRGEAELAVLAACEGYAVRIVGASEVPS